MGIVLIFLKLIIFWGILFFFGYQLAKWLFKKSRIETLIVLSGLIGAGLYVFFINAIGYFVPIGITFYLVLLIFAIIGFILFLTNKPKILNWGINKKWRKILLVTVLLLVIVTFIVDNRFPIGGDQILLSCMPAAATMAEGNFPPKASWVPPYPLRYHYGPHLFAAAIYKITDLPLYMAYDMQVAISVGILFLLGFILIKKFIKDNKKALASSIAMLCAGSLVFLKGAKGIPILYNKYILHQDIFAPFKFVFEMVLVLFSEPAIERMVRFPTNALSFVLIIGIIYLYFSINNNKKIIVLVALLLAVLALFAETFFAVLCFLLLVYPLAYGLLRKNWLSAKKFLISSLLILIIAVPIAFIQGGVLTHYLGVDGHNLILHQTYGYTDTELLERGFEINKTPWILMTRIGKDNKLPIYGLEFLLQWGLLLFLVVVATIYFWKKHFKRILFLILSFFTFFLIPFIIIFPLSLASTERFFYPANLFGGLIAGLLLSSLYFKKKCSKRKWFKKLIICIAVILVLQGLIFQLIFLTTGYPPGKWNNVNEFFAKQGSFDSTTYEWIKKNTTIDDYFLVLESSDYGMGPNAKFIMNTGRITPTYRYRAGYEPMDLLESHAFEQFIKDCDSVLMKYLNYKYLYVNEDWPEGLEEKCLENNDLFLEFEDKERGEFVRIYKVNYDQ